MDTVRTGDRLQRCESFEAGVAWHFVARDGARLAGRLAADLPRRNWNSDWDDFLFKAASRDRLGGAQLRFETEPVSVIAGDAVLGCDSLRTFELAHEFITVAILPADRLAVASLGAGDCVGTNRQEAHIFDSAGEYYIFCPRSDKARGHVNGKLT